MRGAVRMNALFALANKHEFLSFDCPYPYLVDYLTFSPFVPLYPLIGMHFNPMKTYDYSNTWQH